MAMGEYPVLTWPTGFQHLKILILTGQLFKMMGEIRALRKVCIEVTADNPMVFLFSRITMKHLNFDARKIVGHNVSGHKDGLGTEVVDLLHQSCPADISLQREVGYLLLMHIPQHFIAPFAVCFVLNRL